MAGSRFGNIFRNLGKGMERTVERTPDVIERQITHDTLGGRRGMARGAAHAVEEALGTRPSQSGGLLGALKRGLGLGEDVSAGNPGSFGRTAPYSPSEINAHMDQRRGGSRQQAGADTRLTTETLVGQVATGKLDSHTAQEMINDGKVVLPKAEISARQSPAPVEEKSFNAPATAKLSSSESQGAEYFVAAQVQRTELKEKIETHYQSAVTPTSGGFMAQVQQNMGVAANNTAALVTAEATVSQSDPQKTAAARFSPIPGFNA